MPISTIEDIVRKHGAGRAGTKMMTFDGIPSTYGEIDQRSNRVANAMFASGLKPGDRIAVVAKNCTAIFETLFAARKVGAVQVALNWRLSAEEMHYILIDSGATMVFVGAEFTAAVATIVHRLPEGTRMFAIDGAIGGFEAYEDWLAQGATSDPGGVSGPDDTALQLYTSGTTGRPKGVLLMNRSLFAFIDAAQQVFGFHPDGVHVQALPLFHVGGMNWSLQAFAQGAHCIAFRDFDPELVIAEIERSRATHLMTVPAVIQILLARPSVRTTDFSSLHTICYGGSVIVEKVLRDAIATFGCGMYGMYGATELSFGATILTPGEHVDPLRPELLRSCGRPLPGSDIKIVDPASLEFVKPGQTGEIWFRSPQVAKGYWKLPAATQNTFRDDGWYRTGDIGYNVEGFIYISDRLDDMIVSGGENIYPAEIERVLCEHDQVAEAVAFGVPHPVWGETVHAVVVRTADGDVDEATLVAFTRDRLAHFKCPKSLTFAEVLPRNPSGKIQRAVLRKPYWQGQSRRAERPGG